MSGGFTGNPEAAKAAGKLGGEALKKSVEGTDFFAYIGKKGGDELKRKRGPEYFREIGRKGGLVKGARKGKKDAKSKEE